MTAFQKWALDFDDAPDELRTVHYVAGGQFYAIGKGTKFNYGPGKD